MRQGLNALNQYQARLDQQAKLNLRNQQQSNILDSIIQGG